MQFCCFVHIFTLLNCSLYTLLSVQYFQPKLPVISEEHDNQLIYESLHTVSPQHDYSFSYWSINNNKLDVVSPKVP